MKTVALGRFITLEGGEGAGKSTQAKRLAARLEGCGRKALVTREPGGTEKAERVREALLSGDARTLGPFAEAVLFAVAREDHVARKIEHELSRGAWVVCDRFTDSTRAYQGAQGVPFGVLRALERVTVELTRPDLTLILDLDPVAGLARARARRNGSAEADRFERMNVAFHEQIRRRFLEIAETEPARCAVVDAGRSEDEVAEAIWAAVRDRLKP
jgi:dTMP kinase